MRNQSALRRSIKALSRRYASNPARIYGPSSLTIRTPNDDSLRSNPASGRLQRRTVAKTRFASSSSSTSSQHHDGVLHQTYYSLVNKDEVHSDHHQIDALHELERLRNQLLANPPPAMTSASTPAPEPPSTSSFGRWFSQYSQTVSAAAESVRSSFSPIRGAYLHGGVGCGKTFLLNLFYDSLGDVPSWKNERQKHHFHRFMLQVHQQMHAARYADGGRSNKADAILPAVIDKTLQNGRLVYLDEFQVTDVADALILQRLFTGLWERGAVVVATSNRPPDELYWNGIQRDRFLPFIALLKKRCHVVSMWDSETDYRLVQKKLGTSQVYFVGKDSRKDFDKLFYALADGSPVASTYVQAQGRQVPIPQAVLRRGLARFSFEDLCQKALGAADYLQIGQHFHTVFVERIPILTINELNWLRRFITFVDAMYESHVKLVLHAPASPNEIVNRGEGSERRVHDELFAFDRTASRLEEMQSQRYLQKRWAGAQAAVQNDPLPVQVRVEPA